jgi:hypothetical protein
LAKEPFERHVQFFGRERHERAETNAITFGGVCIPVRSGGGCDSIAEKTAQAFDLEVSPAWFKGDFR